jgi:hypothetical protein
MSRGTGNSSFRIREPLKTDAKTKAEAEGVPLSVVVVDLLQAWVDGRLDRPTPDPPDERG